MYESVVLAVLAATVEVVCQVVACWCEVTRERERARLVLAAVRLAGHAVQVEDHRPDGGILTVRGDGLAAPGGREGETR
ncbi:hypothetical protein M2266_000714 [Streptomyces sp. SPB162]|nr:hypothetical protein [Streptomyces sp. SPB162]